MRYSPAIGFISDIRSAKKMPSPEMKERISAALGIAPHMWDMPLEKQPALKPVATPAPVAQPAQQAKRVTAALTEVKKATTLEQLDALLSTVRQQQAACTDDKLLKSWCDAERQVLVQRAKFEETQLELESNFASSTYFTTWWDKVLVVLAPFPDALAAVSEALK
jgi:hypothetical protein